MCFMIVMPYGYLKHIVFVDLKISFIHFQRNFIKNTVVLFIYYLGERSEGQGNFVYPKECVFPF